MTRLSFLVSCRSGASAAEFALVLPLLILLLFGIIDGGRFAYEFNKAEKATQMGARFAVVTTPVPTNLVSADFVGVGGLTPGDTVPAGAMGTIKCNDSQCVCDPGGSVCVGAGTQDAAAFNAIVGHMRKFKPEIDAANVEVLYSGSGLGFAGDPSGMDPSPLITVQLRNVQFRPVAGLGIFNVTLPAFSTSLTAEDLTGSQSN